MSQDFSKGKIYKITNDFNDDVYIGSTCDRLVKRFAAHKAAAKQEKNKNIPLYKLINNVGFERFRIQLIEDSPCNDKYELRQREGHYIRELSKNLNKKIEGRTVKQYYKENKEKILKRDKEYRDKNQENMKEYNKEYYEENKQKIKEYRDNNKEKIKETMKDYRDNNKEKILKRDKEYRDNNKEKIKETNKQYKEDNKEKILDYNKQYYKDNKEKIKETRKDYRDNNKEKIKINAAIKINCLCGSCFRKGDLSKHNKTKKHIEFINNNNSSDIQIE